MTWSFNCKVIAALTQAAGFVLALGIPWGHAHAQSEDAYAIALSLLESKYGPKHPTVALYLGQIADRAQIIGDDVAAESFYRRSLAILEAFSGPEDPSLVKPLLGLAQVLQREERLLDAESFSSRALAIAEGLEDPAAPETVLALWRQANIQVSMNRLASAESNLRRALDVLSSIPPANGPPPSRGEPSQTDVVAELTDVLVMQGRLDDAIVLAAQNIARHEDEGTALSARHLPTLSRLAFMEVLRGDKHAADLWRERALQAVEVTAEHTLLLKVTGYMRLGDYWSELQFSEAAEDAYRKALEVAEGFLGDGSSEVAEILTRLGSLALDRSDANAALKAYRKAYEVVAGIYGSDSLESADLLEQIAHVHRFSENYLQATETLNQVLVIRERAEQGNDAMVAGTMRQLAELHSREVGPDDEAAE
jgi:tetratricopeptide (TPR) repeat protein